jgi:hypothetical protein
VSEQPPSHWIAQCDAGYTAITVFAVDSGVTYYYRGGALIAEVDVSVAGQMCTQGPSTFQVPACGSMNPLCALAEAGADEPAESGDLQ